MPKNRTRAILLVLIAGTVGCKTKQPAVFVDLNRVLATEHLPSVPLTPKPQPTAGIPASVLSFPSVPASAFSLGTDRDRIQQVENVLALSREQAFNQIVSSLKDSYRAEIEHDRQIALVNLRPAEAAGLSEANKQYSEAFSAWADKRAPLVVKLALLATFPDPDPQSLKVPPKDAPLDVLRYKQAKPLREQIAALDKNFYAQKAAIFAQASSKAAQREQTVNSDFDAKIAQADVKANREADAEVIKEQEQLKAVLADKSVVEFPAEPGRTVTIQPTPAPVAPPSVDVPGKAELEDRLRSADASDLKIWAALKGYVISSNRRGVRDATDEFLEWKKSHLASP